MVETRIAPRYRVSKAATIEFVGGRPINCVVRNLSVTGAAIELSDRDGIPDSFLLAIPDDGLRLLCHIVWRTDYRIGVKFD
jgi:PilZ domain